MELNTTHVHSCYEYRTDGFEQVNTAVITETPIALTINGEDWLSFMCSPVDLEALAVGFLFNEGLIHSKDEIASVRVCASRDNVDVWLHHAVEQPRRWQRASGCGGGMCTAPPQFEHHISPNGFTLTPEQVLALMNMLYENQQLHRQVGSTHTSAISDGRSILICTEDIGRNNTLDKLSGHILLDGLKAAQRILLTTGRISFEMLQKAARIEAAVVISRTSPTSLSVEMADRMGITIIGYVRQNKFSIYTHPERVVCTERATDVVHDTGHVSRDVRK